MKNTYIQDVCALLNSYMYIAQGTYTLVYKQLYFCTCVCMCVMCFTFVGKYCVQYVHMRNVFVFMYICEVFTYVCKYPYFLHKYVCSYPQISMNLVHSILEMSMLTQYPYCICMYVHMCGVSACMYVLSLRIPLRQLLASIIHS